MPPPPVGGLGSSDAPAASRWSSLRRSTSTSSSLDESGDSLRSSTSCSLAICGGCCTWEHHTRSSAPTAVAMQMCVGGSQTDLHPDRVELLLQRPRVLLKLVGLLLVLGQLRLQ